MKTGRDLLTRREMLALLAASGAQFGVAGITGCGGASAATGSSMANGSTSSTQPVPSGLVVSSGVSINSVVLGSVRPGYAGLSYEKDAVWRRTLSTANTGLVKLFQLLGSSGILRVGGNTVDQCAYSSTGVGSTFRVIVPSDIDAFAAFARAVNCGVIYGINLRGINNAPPTQTVANAVAEAVYVANALGSNLAYFEIGNEPDLYNTSGGASYTYAQFVALWEPVATAIRAALPAIPLSGPALGSTSNASTWGVPFAAAEKSKGLSLLTQHRYVGDAANASSNDALLLNDNGTTYTPQQMQLLNQASATQGMPWRMSETGSFYDSAAGQQALDYSSALWVIDYLFTNVANNGQGVNLHSGSNFAFAPINDDNAHTVTRVNAVFYGMLLFALGGSGSLIQSSISAPVNASTYTVKVDASHYSTWIVNKDTSASQNLKVTITLPAGVKSATLKIMTGTALNAQSGTTLQGASIGVNGSFSPVADYSLAVSGNTVSCYVPYNSGVLVQSILS